MPPADIGFEKQLALLVEHGLDPARAELLKQSTLNEAGVDMDHLYKKLLRLFFEQNGDRQMIAHQIESFDNFINTKLPAVLRSANPIIVTAGNEKPTNSNPEPLLKDRTLEVRVNIDNFTIRLPSVFENNGVTRPMFPHAARLHNLVYASTCYIDLDITYTLTNADGTQEVRHKRMPNIQLGKIPIMVGSKHCMLHRVPDRTAEELGECRYDPGGYFIIQGGERAVLSLERMAENIPYVFKPSKASNKEVDKAEIKCVPSGADSDARTNVVRLMHVPRQVTAAPLLRASIPRLKMKHDIPICVLFRALGVETDQDIIMMMVSSEEEIKEFSGVLTETLLDVQTAHIKTKAQALDYLVKGVSVWNNRQTKTEVLDDILRKEVLPHIGNKPEHATAKARFLGYMVRKLLRTHFKKLPYDDRDNYMNKRVDAPGTSIGILAADYFQGKLLKEMKTAITKEINSGSWRAQENIVDIINPTNIYKVVKTTVMEANLKSSLATGNFGGGKRPNKVGVSQVLSRMTHLAGISHLRRVATPVEKNGKLIAPRRLHNTQWGFACVAETPEGNSVGVVKNLAATATITVETSTDPIKSLLFAGSWITPLYDMPDRGLTAATHEQCAEWTKVFLNGAWIGMAKAGFACVQMLREAKAQGILHPYTSIATAAYGHELWISTEAGRLIRPILRADAVRELMACCVTVEQLMADMHDWDDVMMYRTESGRALIEYIDSRETENTYIANFPHELSMNPTARFTHCEIHPSVILGVMASMIPFPNYNQSPRNSYQCLHEDTPVLMANGTYMPICLVRPLDMVMGFNPETLELFPTRVTNHFVKPTDKAMFRVVLGNGREITATCDHKFWTDKGWKQVYQLTVGTSKVAVHDAKVNDGRPWFETVQWVLPTDPCNISDITVEADTHCFIADGFLVHNSSMGKQAISIPMRNFYERFDTMNNILCYPQIPLVSTHMSRFFHSHEMPSGFNAVVAVLICGGYNQDDSVILNKAAIERWLAAAYLVRTYKDEEKKNQASGEEEKICRPNPGLTKQLKNANYDKLDESGLVPENTFITSNDILIGKVSPIRVREKRGNAMVDAYAKKRYRDVSKLPRNNENGYVDRNHRGRNGEGNSHCKVRVRTLRIPTIGDKFSSRHGQKGTMGMIYDAADMPRTRDGITPDIIINPHAIPSRMTIAHILETVLGRYACELGVFGDGTPFNGTQVRDIARGLVDLCNVEPYCNEVMYNGRTGEQMDCDIFMGPIQYQRLKHMVRDKIHCLTPDHDVLTKAGWKPIAEVTVEDEVATLQGGELKYARPLKTFAYDYEGQMYKVNMEQVQLCVTPNHKMWVAKERSTSKTPYKLEEAKDIFGQTRRYQKDAKWSASDYQFILPETDDKLAKTVDMDAWIDFFGIWLAEGWANQSCCETTIAGQKERVRDRVFPALTALGYTWWHDEKSDKIHIYDKQLYAYMRVLSVGATSKSAPAWVWELSQKQSLRMLEAMICGDGHIRSGKDRPNGTWMYLTSSTALADDVQRLALHAGFSASKRVHHEKGTEYSINSSDGRVCTGVTTETAWTVGIIRMKNRPTANVYYRKKTGNLVDSYIDYSGGVYCLEVPGNVFYVRQHGVPVWTGNSRASGPVVLLSRQPAEGRARDGGLRFGEMERDCVVAHGVSTFTEERMMVCSDNYRLYVCSICCMPAIVNPEERISMCKTCDNYTDFREVRIPYACKLFFQELQSMNICTRIIPDKLLRRVQAEMELDLDVDAEPSDYPLLEDGLVEGEDDDDGEGGEDDE
jgi:DNA-directed RNA polymerase beta subunit